MSGHSKWSSIKHKKAAADAKRGKLFTKLGRAITIAARDGGGDPDSNPGLALAIQKARDASMPKDNIQRAIERGTGDGGDAASIEEVRYEGYGPGGVAIMVDAYTDNRNRTGSDVRHLFEKSGGSLGEPGSVAWQFDRRGVIEVSSAEHDEDELMPAIDAGAEDVSAGGETLRILTPPPSLGEVRAALAASGVEVRSSEVSEVPRTTVEVADRQAEAVLKLLEALDDHDDVDRVHSSIEVADELLEAMHAG